MGNDRADPVSDAIDQHAHLVIGALATEVSLFGVGVDDASACADFDDPGIGSSQGGLDAFSIPSHHLDDPVPACHWVLEGVFAGDHCGSGMHEQGVGLVEECADQVGPFEAWVECAQVGADGVGFFGAMGLSCDCADRAVGAKFGCPAFVFAGEFSDPEDRLGQPAGLGEDFDLADGQVVGVDAGVELDGAVGVGLDEPIPVLWAWLEVFDVECSFALDIPACRVEVEPGDVGGAVVEGVATDGLESGVVLVGPCAVFA